MGLDEYLNLNGLSLRKFARMAGLSAATVLRVRDGKVIASRRTLLAIVDATDGQVGVSDIIRLGESEAEEKIS